MPKRPAGFCTPCTSSCSGQPRLRSRGLQRNQPATPFTLPSLRLYSRVCPHPAERTPQAERKSRCPVLLSLSCHRYGSSPPFAWATQRPASSLAPPCPQWSATLQQEAGGTAKKSRSGCSNLPDSFVLLTLLPEKDKTTCSKNSFLF